MEIFQEYGNDLVLTPDGDLQTADTTILSEQRIIRRLLTTPITVNNPPDYLDFPNYGAGLPQFIGRLNTPDIYSQIVGLITASMYQETTVSQNPPPTIVVSGLPNRIQANITYTNVLTNSQAVINFTIPTPLPNTLYATLGADNAS